MGLTWKMLFYMDTMVNSTSFTIVTVPTFPFIMFCCFHTDGWTYGLPQTTDNDGTHKTISQAQFYAYCLYTCENEFPTLHSRGRLF